MPNQFYGFYEHPGQKPEEPTYDPPHQTACLFCGEAISTDDVRTHALMYTSNSYAKRSYFYRTHRTCAVRDVEEKSGDHTGMDGFILDMIQRNGD